MNLKAMALAGALAGVAATGAGTAQAASFMNGSFENGFGDGWIVSNDALISNPSEANHLLPSGMLDPAVETYTARGAGYFFAELSAGARNEAVTLRQPFETAGGLFTGFAAFLGGDYIDPGQENVPPADRNFNDYAYVRIFGGADPEELFFQSIFLRGNYGHTDWMPITAMLARGVYTVEAGVVNIGDGRNDSRLLIDAFTVPAAVPEPASWAMMILGFFGLGALVRRRRAAFA